VPDQPRVTTASWALRSGRLQIERVPGLLPDDPNAANAIHTLLRAVDEDETSGQPECGMLWMAAQPNLASCTFLGGRFALTSLHCVVAGGADVHVTLPADVISEIRPENSFHVLQPVPAPGGQDCALLPLDVGGAPAVDQPSITSAQEVQQAATVQICGFGSNNCDNPAGAGFKRLSRALPIIRDTTDPANCFMGDNGGPNPVACHSDSGGGAYISVGGTLKLAGIIVSTVTFPNGKSTTRIVRLAPLIPWLTQVTRLQF